MYSLLAYGNAAQAAGATLADTPAVVDPNFSSHNGHWIFTKPYKLYGIAVFGASLTAAQLFDSTYNAINVPQIYPVNLSPTPPSNPQIRDLRSFPIGLPIDEEIALQLSNGLGAGTEAEFGLLWVAPDPSSMQLPPPAGEVGNKGRVLARFTVTTPTTAGLWSADAAIVIPNLLRGGTYTVAGLTLVSVAGVAYRVNFVNQRFTPDRKLTPGNLVENAYGNIPLYQRPDWLGPLGDFDTWELPLLSILGATTAASATYSGFLDLIYRGPGRVEQYQMGV